VKNLQFAGALEDRVRKIYQNSWIALYYRVVVKTDQGNVFFWDTTSKNIPENYRYGIFLYIPEKTKPYFLTKYDWEQIKRQGSISSDMISNITHGFKSRCPPATKSIFHMSPFFIKIKTPIQMSNYLLYKGFFKNNKEDCILAMIIFDEDKEILRPEFAPHLSLKQLQNSSLINKNFEFILTDANNQQILIEDNSQLFFSLKIISA
jgi:hypothetical protein